MRIRGTTLRTLAPALAVALTLILVASAQAASQITVPGLQGVVGCISKSLCVTGGYNAKGKGELVVVDRGKVKHVSLVKHADSITAISCFSSGCVAVPELSTGAVEFITLSKSGAVRSTEHAKVASGEQVSRIDCRSAKSCVVSGAYFFSTPAKPTFGTWNGKKLKLDRISAPVRAQTVDSPGLSCVGATCWATVTEESGAKVHSSIYKLRDGRPSGKPHTVSGEISAIGCTSARVCWGGGPGTSTAGFLVKITDGVAGAKVGVAGEPYSIACHRSSCLAAGEQLPPEDSGLTQAYEGVTYPLSAVGVGTPTAVPQVLGFTGVAAAGAQYAAVGDKIAKGVFSLLSFS